MKPSYIIIGVQKSATTSAIVYLNQHPKIFCNWGELHFFDDNEKYRNGIQWYENKLAENNKYNKKIIGVKTPFYIFSKKSIDRIYKHYPNIKLIIFLRDPVTRAFSQYNHMIQESKKKMYLINLE